MAAVSPETLETLAAQQRALAQRVLECPLPKPPQWLAGADVHLLGNQAVAVVVILDAATLAVHDVCTATVDITFPYVPGFLSFREAPAVLAALTKLSQPPELLFIDGQGKAHPRRCGLACHIGVTCDLPTIGVAKSKLCGVYHELENDAGATAPLIDHGEVVGMAVRTRTGVAPVFVSVGHHITLGEAVDWVLRTARYRIPEPTRQAHRYAQQAVARFRAQSP